MVSTCAAFNCTNRRKKDSGISFHSFPLQKRQLLAKWLSAVKRKDFVPSQHHRLCSVHFNESCFWKSNGNRLLKDEAVPSLFDFPSHLKKVEKPSRRILKRMTEPTNLSKTNEVHLVNDSRYLITSEHNYAVSPGKRMRSLQNVLEKKDTLIQTLRTENVKYKKKCNRQQNKITDLKCVIADLKERNLINEHTQWVIDNNFSDVMYGLITRAADQKNVEYSDILKKFAITMHFYSPAAYEYLRQSVNKSLPHINTIRKWHNTVSGNPGFTEEAFLALEERVSLSPHPIYISFVFDEMSIRKCIEWNGKCFIGYVDLGDDVCVSDTQEAKEVLVLMAVAVNASWKIPIGYFLTNGLSAHLKLNIIKESILRLQSIKLHVISLTCDGLSSNVAMGNELGCNFQAESLNPSFKVGEQNIQMMFDACHMMKLARNCFGDLKIIKDQNGNLINWKYIELLDELQQNESLCLANKVTKHHVRYAQQKMKVKLAVQVLSASVGNALLFLCHDLKLKEFEGVEATAEFCLFFDKLFDLFNSKNPLAKGYKAVMSKRNEATTLNFLDSAESYLLGLRDQNDRHLYQTPRKTAIIGFLSLCRGFRNLYEELVESKKLKYLATYKFSQDHIELFFSQVRSRLGYNNNPSALQFKAAYKHLLVVNEVKNKLTGNVTERSETKLLPWCGANIQEDPQCFSNERRYQEYDSPPSDDLYSSVFFTSLTLTEYIENVVAYIAGFVVRQVSKKIHCDTCEEALYGDENAGKHLTFLLRKNNGGLIVPSSDIIKICRLTETAVRILLLENNGVPPKGPLFSHVKRMVMEELDTAKIFPQLNEHILENEFPENHVLRIVHLTVELYIKIRCHHTAKSYNVSLHKKIVRQHLTKSILFMNQ